MKSEMWDNYQINILEKSNESFKPGCIMNVDWHGLSHFRFNSVKGDTVVMIDSEFGEDWNIQTTSGSERFSQVSLYISVSSQNTLEAKIEELFHITSKVDVSTTKRVSITIDTARFSKIEDKSWHEIKEKIYAASKADKDSDEHRFWHRVKDRCIITSVSFVKKVTFKFDSAGSVAPKVDVKITGKEVDLEDSSAW
eukprot:CAMPEP_0168529674 /NCGR_PEP_ID=MMETSP0405-20121227/14085_1 /TAXON_ID=498012 /ORGANISM="Trichosphaerium sp, Strain Am-I-7 wt" /LENGTH=195 /DNA_ID=CAMNT_0008553515 /DNA_START=1 /DNA_END=585 /DNA_ORIENTATION=-